MKRHSMGILAMFLVLATLMGCAGKIRYPSYYTLNLPAPPDLPQPESGHAILAVREFRSPAYLRQGAIVYRPSAEEIGFYNYQRWAVDPRELVTHAIEERLKAGGTFAQVSRYDGHSDTNYVMSGRLEKLEEIDYEGGVKVAVAISAEMTNVASGATVWNNEVTETGTVERRDISAVVSVMSRTMDRAITKLLESAPRLTLGSESRKTNEMR